MKTGLPHDSPINPLICKSARETLNVVAGYIDHLRGLYGEASQVPPGLHIELQLISEAISSVSNGLSD